MSVTEIEARAGMEARLYDAAKRIREILDAAEQTIDLPDRDVAEEILTLVQE